MIKCGKRAVRKRKRKKSRQKARQWTWNQKNQKGGRDRVFGRGRRHLTCVARNGLYLKANATKNNSYHSHTLGSTVEEKRDAAEKKKMEEKREKREEENLLKRNQLWKFLKPQYETDSSRVQKCWQRLTSGKKRFKTRKKKKHAKGVQDEKNRMGGKGRIAERSVTSDCSNSKKKETVPKKRSKDDSW